MQLSFAFMMISDGVAVDDENNISLICDTRWAKQELTFWFKKHRVALPPSRTTQNTREKYLVLLKGGSKATFAKSSHCFQGCSDWFDCSVVEQLLISASHGSLYMIQTHLYDLYLKLVRTAHAGQGQPFNLFKLTFLEPERIFVQLPLMWSTYS